MFKPWIAELLDDRIRLSKKGSWEWNWLNSKLDKWFDYNNGWDSRAHARRKLLMKVNDLMYQQGWYRTFSYDWIRICKDE